jgi:hypothetical protein
LRPYRGKQWVKTKPHLAVGTDFFFGFDIADVAYRLWLAVSVLLISGMPDGHAGQIFDPRDQYLQKPFAAAVFYEHWSS